MLRSRSGQRCAPEVGVDHDARCVDHHLRPRREHPGSLDPDNADNLLGFQGGPQGRFAKLCPHDLLAQAVELRADQLDDQGLAVARDQRGGGGGIEHARDGREAPEGFGTAYLPFLPAHLEDPILPARSMLSPGCRPLYG